MLSTNTDRESAGNSGFKAGTLDPDREKEERHHSQKGKHKHRSCNNFWNGGGAGRR